MKNVKNVVAALGVGSVNAMEYTMKHVDIVINAINTFLNQL